MNKERIGYLDMVKGIGIILVVMGHSEYLAGNVRIVITSFHMSLFFIVSGMLIYQTREERRRMSAILKRKSCGMLVPYVVFSAVYLAIYKKAVAPETFDGFLIQTFGLGGMSVLWFLTALFFAELAFLALRKACKKNHAVTILVCAACAVLAPFLKTYLDAGFPRTNIALKLAGELLGTFLRSMVALGFLMAGYYLMPLLGLLDKRLFGEVCGESAAIDMRTNMSARSERRQSVRTDGEELNKPRRLLLAGAGILGLFLTVFLSLSNGLTDLRFMVFNRLWIYYPNALLATCSLILICKYGGTLRGICYLGANSLIIMVTHLDCFMLKAIDVGNFFVSVSPRGKQYCLYFGIAFGLLVMELVTIYIVNHFLPFVIGKTYPGENGKIVFWKRK